MTVVFDDMLDDWQERAPAIVTDLTETLTIEELADLLVAEEVAA